MDKLKRTFEDLKEVEIEVRPAHSDKRLAPPTKLKNGWFARPFSMFVEMYGTPEYEAIDPTPIVAVTYTLLFGMKFGDVGQGLVLILVGYLAYKYKGMQLGDVGVRIGISSTIFGFIYGSVFGNETLLNPVYQTVFGLSEKPIEVMTSEFIPILLVLSVGIGAFLIIFSMCVNIFLQIKNKNMGELFFSQNGVAGLVFYTSLVGGLAYTLLSGNNLFTIPFVLVCLILPLVLIFMKEPFTNKLENKAMYPEGFGAFCIESIFELLEVCLSYITNTISYLRVGGFVLSHAGMMMAVTLIMGMVGSAGGLLVGIFGNILVMCLEGMIVGIQVLRLEFYEMFSRYFNGNGVAFQSLKELN